MAEYTAIPVFKETKERVDKIARKDQTYDDFINELLDKVDKVKK